MAERMVFLRYGRRSEAVPLLMELSDEQVTLSVVVPSDQAKAQRALNDLHLQFFFTGTPHDVRCRNDEANLRYVDALVMPLEIAESELFPKLIGLADSADSTPGIH